MPKLWWCPTVKLSAAISSIPRADPERRTEITLGVAYNADIDVVKKY